jgi:hypothetical protein
VLGALGAFQGADIRVSSTAVIWPTQKHGLTCYGAVRDTGIEPDDNRRYALVVCGLLLGQVYDGRSWRVRLDRLNALLSVGLGLVTLAGGDDLAVGGLEVEPRRWSCPNRSPVPQFAAKENGRAFWPGRILFGKTVNPTNGVNS